MTDRDLEKTHRTPPRSHILGLLLLTVVVRLGFMVAQWDRLSDDPDSYRMIAQTLRQHGVIGWVDDTGNVRATAYRPPLYPILLAITSPSGNVTPQEVAVLHLLLGIATVLVVQRLGWKFHALRFPNLPALGVALDPLLLNQSTQVMTETFATFMAVAAWALLIAWSENRSRTLAAVVGVVLALSALCRPTFLPWLMVCICGMWFTSPAKSGRRFAVIALITASIGLAPWAVRNYFVLRCPTVTTTHGGYTLLLANNESFYRYLQVDAASPWSAEPVKQLLQEKAQERGLNTREDEVQVDKLANSLAWETIRKCPREFIWSCLYRWGQLWAVLAHPVTAESTASTWGRFLVAVLYCTVFLFSMLGVISLRGSLYRSPWLWGIALCAVTTAVHTLYWTNMRMRSPLMPFVYLLAAYGLEVTWQSDLRSRLARRRAPELI